MAITVTISMCRGVGQPMRVVNTFAVVDEDAEGDDDDGVSVQIKREGESPRNTPSRKQDERKKWTCPAWAAAVKIGLVVSAACREI